jgi:hypothetical protein
MSNVVLGACAWWAVGRRSGACVASRSARVGSMHDW